MNILLLLGLVAVATVAHANQCVNMDPSGCSNTCTAPEVVACERDICTCAPPCKLASDCTMCHDETLPDGHTEPVQAHCVDGACSCDPAHHGPPGGPIGGHHPPGK